MVERWWWRRSRRRHESLGGCCELRRRGRQVAASRVWQRRRSPGRRRRARVRCSASSRSRCSASASAISFDGSAASRTILAVSRISRIGSSKALLISDWNPVPIFLSSLYVCMNRRTASGSRSGPSTTSAISRMTMISLPCRLNTGAVYGAAIMVRSATTTPLTARSTDHVRPSWGACARAGEHTRGLCAGLEARCIGPRERCLDDRRRRCRARSRRGGQERAPQASDQGIPPRRAPNAHSDARRTARARAAPTTHCRSISRIPTAPSASSKRSPTSTPTCSNARGSANRAWNASSRCGRCSTKAAAPRFGCSRPPGSSGSRELRNDAPSTSSRHGIDGINLHRTDWNGGLVALFHRFGLVAFGWDLQHEHDLRPALRMGLDAVYSDHVDVMTDAFIAEIGTL